MLRVLTDGLAQQIGLAHHVTDVVGHLVSLAQTVTQSLPLLGVCACAQSAGTGGRYKQRTGFGALVLHERDTGFRFPGLAGHNA